ncbi:MAG: hypothetical protein ABI242_07620 [Caulobacteraceae bacterium]
MARARGASPTGLYAIGARLATAAFSFASGVVAVALFEPARIGLFLSFSSLAAFSSLADLGMTYSLLLAAATRGADEARRLATAAIVTAIPIVVVTGTALFLGGAFFFKGGAGHAQWLWPWASYCAASSIQQVLTLIVTYAEGTGGRHAAWRANFWFEVAAGIAFLTLIGLGAELWSFTAASIVRVTMILILFARRFELFNLGNHSIAARLALWRRHLWPMQWKILVNNALGLLTTRLLTPILLATEGASAAGRVGLILALGSVITAATVAWPLSQTSIYAALYQEGRGKDLSLIFRKTFVQSTALSISLFLLAAIACVLAVETNPHLARQLPEPPVIWVVLLASPFAHISSCCAVFLRSQRHDPVVIPNLVLALPTLAILTYAARTGAATFAAAFCLLSVVFAMLYGGYLLQFLRRLRHAS